MPNKRAAIKALHQTAKRTQRNRRIVSELRTLSRRLDTHVAANQMAEASAFLPTLMAKLDRAAGQHVLPRNTVNRRKSRYARLIKQHA